MQFGRRTQSPHSRVMLAMVAFALIALAGAGFTPKIDGHDPSKPQLKSPSAKVDATHPPIEIVPIGDAGPIAVRPVARVAPH